MKIQAGTGPCLACGQTIPYKLADSGALSVCCPWCDFSGYARAGTQARRIIEPKMTLAAAAQVPAVVPPAPVADPVSGLPVPPAPKKKTATIWD